MNSLRTLILALVLSIGISYAYAAWSPPTQTPPLGNIDAPVNVGTGSQTKQGDLSSNSFMSAVQGFFGSVGIGTASVPASLKLGVAGNVGADQYCDRDGNNCTAAASLGGGGGSYSSFGVEFISCTVTEYTNSCQVSCSPGKVILSYGLRQHNQSTDGVNHGATTINGGQTLSVTGAVSNGSATYIATCINS